MLDSRPPLLRSMAPPALLALFYGGLAWHFAFPYAIDDAAIYYRYVEMWRHGQGFAYNLGDPPSYGASSPLFLIILTAASYSGANLQLLSMGIGLVCGAVCVLLAYAIGRSLYVSPFPAFLGAASAAMAPLFLIWTMSGMETAMHLALQLAALLAYLRRRPALCGLLGGLAIVSKLDAVFLVAVLLLLLGLESRRSLLRAALALLLAAGPAIGVLWLYFGAPIPTSMLAKMRNSAGGMAPRAWMIEMLIKGNLGEICLAGLPFVLARGNVPRRLALPLWMGTYLAGYLLFRAPEPYHWYAAPMAFALFLLSGQGLGVLAEKAWESRREVVPVAAFAALGGLLWLREARYLQSSRDSSRGWIMTVGQDLMDAAHWLDRHAPEDATIATPYGWPAYATFPRRVIDLAGLTDLRFAGRHFWEALPRAEFPDYVVAQGPKGRLYRLPPEFDGEYATVISFDRSSSMTGFGAFTILKRKRAGILGAATQGP